MKITTALMLKAEQPVLQALQANQAAAENGVSPC
jgi:hypothetical protein